MIKFPKKTKKPQKNGSKGKQQKSSGKPTAVDPITPILPSSLPEIPRTIMVDITKETYVAAKMDNLARVPKLARPFVKQYFDFLVKLTPDQVLDWMEGAERLKDLYAKASFPERIAFAGARGLIKASQRIKQDAEKAINWQVAAYTIRFENPGAWEVIQAFGEEGMEKLKQGVEDIKVILGILEEA